ncbi:hypothetical protein B0A55_12351 [Friedmanniomyces simplex]|uniref:Xylanolytic transcriptional activator regulatory domain-containing protein n=1 Tax=Friedmanniomyces simplex TaxID=329884 RepID=A0A4U0VTK4_9PEZI|nr:hypothetical protein B0A55_12351 [Friedmanniomyces simplex]
MQTDVAYGPPKSVPPDQQYYREHAPTAMPADARSYFPPQQPVQPSLYRSYTEPVSALPELPTVLPPILTESKPQRLPGEHFLPYVQLFFGHMFPIMPVIDRNLYLDARLYADTSTLGSDVYCLLCALCAATIVQLDASIPLPYLQPQSKPTDDVFAEECLRERKTYDYITATSTLSCMTSFFLFAYYGNHESHAKAWFYLQEAITFAENLNMDDEQTYAKLDPVEAQWRRRLYWLLFVTERAHAVQRRKNTRLHLSVAMPIVFQSEDPHLLNGFVNHANLFSAVDDNFVSAWRGSRRQSLCNEAWLAHTQKQLDTVALALDNISETQHLDISVTREWLHVLAWQIGVSNGLIWGKEEAGTGMRLEYPIELARRVVQITNGANKVALDSHGIGMEQKLSDIAGCLADVLRCTAGDTSATFVEGKQYLNILLRTLSSIRGKESRYLKPLLAKMDALQDHEMHDQHQNPHLALPTIDTPHPPAGFPPTVVVPHAGGGSNEYLHPTSGSVNGSVNGSGSGNRPRTWSIADSVGMLRTLSMSGNLGMPFLVVSGEEWEWQPRRPSGRVYEEVEMREGVQGGWGMVGVV